MTRGSARWPQQRARTAGSRNEAGGAIRVAGLQAMDFADAAARLPLRADLLGVCHGGGRAPRRAARKPGWRSRGCCAVIPLRARDTIPCRRRIAKHSGFGPPDSLPAKFAAPLEWNFNLAEYRNPQQEPGGESRMLIVFAVTFALILISQFFLFKNKSKQQPKPNPRRNLAVQRAHDRQPQPEAATAPAAAVSKRHAPATPSLRKLRSHEGGQQRSRDRGRERPLPHRLHQPRRAGQVVDPEEVQGRRRAIRSTW